LPVEWYALRSKPHKEESLQRYVGSQGYEVYYPRLHVKPVNPRSRKIKPYFPGYMFVRACLESAGERAFRYLPFSQGLVWLGGRPAVVPQAVIAGLQARLAQIEAQGGLRGADLAPGERVVVCGGAFEGYEGIFDGYLSGQERVRILLKMLNDRLLRVDIGRAWVEKDRRV
jgi:transcriptional antiterminator RfaH